MPSVIDKSQLEEITKLRKTLHSYPELSGHEEQTAGRIKAFLTGTGPDNIIEGLGGHGLAAIYESGTSGPAVLLRADLDALPIDEVNGFAHRSRHQDVSHKCGHDGHMAILAGMSEILKNNRPSKGRVILLFQPEEETGQGAAKVIADPKFDEIRPDFVFALHNLPGYEKSTVVFKEGPFASASTGIIIRMQGRSSHAAHPEQGNSPIKMMTETIRGLMSIPIEKSYFKDFVLLTVIHAQLGEVAFGTTPGKAVVMATLRTYLDDDMSLLKKKAEGLVKKLEKEYDIQCSIGYTEEFPATINHPEVTELVEEAIRKTEARHETIKEPFRWSEDFGHFTSVYQGALFGIGSGKDHPSLHNHDYDFPDEIMETGINIFYHITDKLVKFKQ
jgi:amidohydrolase